MTSLVVGLGEIGKALHDILKEKYGDKVIGFDAKCGVHCQLIGTKVDILHICIPWSEDFISIVEEYRRLVEPRYVVVHSSVPVGVCSHITAFHSPVRGKHPNMSQGLKNYTKYVSFDGPCFEEAKEVAAYMEAAGIPTKVIRETKVTELGKLLALCRYGVYIAFAKEQERICEKFDVPYYKVVTDFEETRNKGLQAQGCEKLIQPLLYPFENFVGGHCTVEDMEILLEQLEEDYAPLLEEAYITDKNTTIWGNCNIYPTAKIGKGCSIGFGTEIGKDVQIGNNVRIGAHCFIPEGVTIEDDVFIAPKVTFSNDKHPPSDKKYWGEITVCRGATIGMGAIILPDVRIGGYSMVGAGSIVTKSVPDYEIWYGQAAYKHGEKDVEKEEDSSSC